MRHCDDETLAAIALGEPAESRDAAHVSECATCAAEVASLLGFDAIEQGTPSSDADIEAQIVTDPR